MGGYPQHNAQPGMDTWRNENGFDTIPMVGIPTEAPTTLMIRNIPPMYTQETLLQEWPNCGTYDFFYLPCTFTLSRNKSYAFMNFTSPEAAWEFTERWNKNRLPKFTARKSLSVLPAHVQGLEANLCSLSKNSNWRLKVRGCQPLIFDNGRLITLEEAFERLGPQSAMWSF